MACVHLPPGQASCLFQELVRTVMLLEGLCDAGRLPRFCFQISLAVFLPDMQHCGRLPPYMLVMWLFFYKLIKVAWVKYQFTAGTEGLVASLSMSNQIGVPHWIKARQAGQTFSLGKVACPFPKTRGAGQAEHLCTALWAMAHVLVVRIAEGQVYGCCSFGKFCFWLRILWTPFLLAAIYSGEGKLKFTTWKHWGTSAVVSTSSQC